jgi:hypothetical protein
LVFTRFLRDKKITVILNTSKKEKEVIFPSWRLGELDPKEFKIKLKPIEARILIGTDEFGNL